MPKVRPARLALDERGWAKCELDVIFSALLACVEKRAIQPGPWGTEFVPKEISPIQPKRSLKLLKSLSRFV
jgi:hypothetical protein